MRRQKFLMLSKEMNSERQRLQFNITVKLVQLYRYVTQVVKKIFNIL
jgi:hypothetical protein